MGHRNFVLLFAMSLSLLTPWVYGSKTAYLSEAFTRELGYCSHIKNPVIAFSENIVEFKEGGETIWITEFQFGPTVETFVLRLDDGTERSFRSHFARRAAPKIREAFQLVAAQTEKVTFFIDPLFLKRKKENEYNTDDPTTGHLMLKFQGEEMRLIHVIGANDFPASHECADE